MGGNKHRRCLLTEWARVVFWTYWNWKLIRLIGGWSMLLLGDSKDRDVALRLKCQPVWRGVGGYTLLVLPWPFASSSVPSVLIPAAACLWHLEVRSCILSHCTLGCPLSRPEGNARSRRSENQCYRELLQTKRATGLAKLPPHHPQSHPALPGICRNPDHLVGYLPPAVRFWDLPPEKPGRSIPRTIEGLEGHRKRAWNHVMYA
jgi:hypothetical protein